jgi:hypothetical protein
LYTKKVVINNNYHLHDEAVLGLLAAINGGLELGQD